MEKNFIEKTPGQRLSEIYEEIEDRILSKPEGVRSDLTLAGFMAAAHIMLDALMDKMWELQEKENIPFEQRLKMAEHFGEQLHKLILEATGIDTKKYFTEILAQLENEGTR